MQNEMLNRVIRTNKIEVFSLSLLLNLFVILFPPCTAVSLESPHSSDTSTSGTNLPPLETYRTTIENISLQNFGIINAITRDDRGFLWYGTTGGLCKYDGYQVGVFTHETRLVNYITAITRMAADSLLLATGKGLWTFNLKSEQFTPFLQTSDFSNEMINAVVISSSGTLWIGTASHGLYSYNQTTHDIHRYDRKNGLSDDRISCLLLDNSGILWIGMFSGGLKAVPESSASLTGFIGSDIGTQFQTWRSSVSDPLSLQSDRVTALCKTGSDELWIGTARGLSVLDPTRKHIHRLTFASPFEHSVLSIEADRLGRVWVAVSELGVLVYSNGTYTSLPSSNENARRFIGSRLLYLDPVESTNGRALLWVGTRTGVEKVFMTPNPFKNYFRNQDSLLLARGAILSMREDRKGILWAGLWGGGLEGLQRINGKYKRIAHFEHISTDSHSLPDNNIGTIFEDLSGNLWVGTGSGIAIVDSERKHIRVYTHVEGDSLSLIGNGVNAIYSDRSGNFWICTQAGLSRIIQDSSAAFAKESLDNSVDKHNRSGAHVGKYHFRNYLYERSDAHPIGGNEVYDVLESRSSDIWVATWGRGLNKLEANGTFSRFLYPGDSLGNKENIVYTFAEDPSGILWLSTAAGLIQFDPHSGVFSRRPIHQLYDTHIFGMAVDRLGDLWLATGIGLARFNPKTQTFVRYDEKDGMPFKEFFSGFSRNGRGQLLVGGLDGFTEFFPESVSTTSRTPELAITSFSVFNKDLPVSRFAPGEIILAHDQNLFSFSFAVLDYVNPLRNRFAYKMVGVDKDWIESGTHNYVSYANLGPGSYVFRVKGCNSDNVWNETGTSLSIIITPPYWQTWWFRALIVVLIGSATYTAYRYRLNKLLEVERLRLRIADDLHDDVGSNLSTIAMASRAAQRTSELSAASKRKLEEIYDTAITTSESMKDIVWFIKPKNDTLDDLVLRMKDVASSLLVNIVHDFSAPDDGGSVRISIDFKRNFFLAFKEILTNIVKHASATKVQILVGQRDGILETIIEDNGNGFDLTNVGTTRRGNGLVSLQSRAHNIGGVCEITSGPGKGTRVKFFGKL